MYIYVASLSDYNNGILHGVNIELDEYTTQNDIWDSVNEMLRNSPATKKYGEVAEEWAIHDYDLDGVDIGENENFGDIIDLVELLDKYGEAYRIYLDDVGSNFASVSDFEERYRGEYKGKVDFAEQFVDDIGMLHDVPDTIALYFDYESFAHDLFIDGYWGEFDSNMNFHVFSRA
jgi:antirestriction protein